MKNQEEKLKVANEKAEGNEQLGDSIQLIVFKQGEEEYALNIDQIKEVVITPNITRMPQTPDFVKGVANIRGNIIAILDLEEKFGLKKSQQVDNEEKNFTLVIESEEFKVGILVREVPNTLVVREGDIDEAVNIIHDSAMEQNYITGIVKQENGLIILIDILKVVTESELNTVTQVTS